MTGNLFVGVAVLGGMIATLAVIAGLLVRAGGLAADREFSALRRPDSLADFPFVTVIVPTRDEERNIAFCLESLLALDYPGFEILVVDDHSTDRTTRIVRETIGKHAKHAPQPAVRLFPLDDHPDEGGPNWVCRKSLALWQGARRAQGGWILFVDADTRQKPDALWRAIYFARSRGLQALSMSGVNVNPGFWGGLLEALINPAIFLAIPWRRVNDPLRPEAWMNGNFILYRRSKYLAVDGHRAVAGFIADDLALAIHSKKMGVRSLFLPVSSAYECRDYVGLGEAFRGWTRRLAVGGGRLHLHRRFYALVAGTLFCIAVWPVFAVAAALLGAFGRNEIAGQFLTSCALAQLGLVILLQAALRRVMKMPVWPAMFAPLGALLGIGVAAAGYRARYMKKVIEFRGRTLPVDDDIASSSHART
jgi:chlorobactene glucosyltransferase